MEKSYSKLSVGLHALQGLLIAFVLLTGSLVLAQMPNTVEKLGNYKIHIILGLVVFALTIIRYLAIRKQKLEPLEMPAFRQKIMNLNHKLIYVVLVLVSLSGILMAQRTGLGQMVFFKEPFMAINFEEMPMAQIHEVLTTVLIFLVGMHLVGVLSYSLKSKQNILKRVWFK